MGFTKGSLILFDTILYNSTVLILIFRGAWMKRISTILILLSLLQGCMSSTPRTAAEIQRSQQMGCALMALSGNPSMASNYPGCGVSKPTNQQLYYDPATNAMRPCLHVTASGQCAHYGN